MKSTLTALPAIYYRERLAAGRDIPEPPKAGPGQTLKFNPLDRRWRIYTPKQPKYRVVFDTDELVYLERRFQNAQLEEARNDMRAIKLSARKPGPKTFAKVAGFEARAKVARAEADACARTINEIKAQL